MFGTRTKRNFDQDASNERRKFDNEIRKQPNMSKSGTGTTVKNELLVRWVAEEKILKEELDIAISQYKNSIGKNKSLYKLGLKPDDQKSWSDWFKNKGQQPSAQDYRGLQQKGRPFGTGTSSTGTGPGFFGRLFGQTGDSGTSAPSAWENILRSRRSGTPMLPPGPVGRMPYQPTVADLQREATRPGFTTFKDPATGTMQTIANLDVPMETAADYARLQKAITTLDPSKIKAFMTKLGDIAATLPATQAAKILEQFQRRVLNELDKFCIRQGWLLFNETNNRCV
jgi:hypothetical protein